MGRKDEGEQRGREERLCITWSEKLSRKGFVAWFGRIVLRAIGISFVSFLPVDRIVQIAKGQTNCFDWTLCGIFGTLCCSGCTGGIGNHATCPTCSTRGSGFWDACCPDNQGFCRLVHYYDCCSSTTCSCPVPPCIHCETKEQPAWCTGNTHYVCTVVLLGGPGTCQCL